MADTYPMLTVGSSLSSSHHHSQIAPIRCGGELPAFRSPTITAASTLPMTGIMPTSPSRPTSSASTISNSVFDSGASVAASRDTTISFTPANLSYKLKPPPPPPPPSSQRTILSPRSRSPAPSVSSVTNSGSRSSIPSTVAGSSQLETPISSRQDQTMSFTPITFQAVNSSSQRKTPVLQAEAPITPLPKRFMAVNQTPVDRREELATPWTEGEKVELLWSIIRSLGVNSVEDVDWNKVELPKNRPLRSAEEIIRGFATPPLPPPPAPPSQTAIVSNVEDTMQLAPIHPVEAIKEQSPPPPPPVAGGQVMMFTPVNNYINHNPEAPNTSGSGNGNVESTGKKKNKKRKLEPAGEEEQQQQQQQQVDVVMETTPTAVQEIGEPTYTHGRNEEASGSPSPNEDGAGNSTGSAGKSRSKRAKSESPPLQLDLSNPRITNYLKKAGYMNDDGTPAKRKRGRPTKDPFGLSVTLKKQLMALDPNAPPSKKRGRPRKNFLLLDDDDFMALGAGVDDETEAEEEFDGPGGAEGGGGGGGGGMMDVEMHRPPQPQFRSVNGINGTQVKEEKPERPLPTPAIVRSNAPKSGDQDISPGLRRAIEKIGEGLASSTTINLDLSGSKPPIPSSFMAVSSRASAQNDDTEDEEHLSSARQQQSPPPASRPHFQQQASDRYMRVAEQVDRFKQQRDSGEGHNRPFLNVPTPADNQQTFGTATIPVRRSSHGTLGHILN